MKRLISLAFIASLMFPVAAVAQSPSLSDYSQTLLDLKKAELVRLENGETGVEGYAMYGNAAPAFLLTGDAELDQFVSTSSRIAVLGEEIAYLTLLLTQLNQAPDSDIGSTRVTAAADSHVYAYDYLNWNRSNWGAYNVLGAGWHPAGGEKRTYIKFDLAYVDEPSIGKAVLRLFHYHTGGGNGVALGVHRVTSPWQEGVGTYKPATPAGPNELTWEVQPTFDLSPVLGFNPGIDANKWVELDITPLVKEWLAGVPNFGLVIKPQGPLTSGVPESQYGFRSRELEDKYLRPSLVLFGDNGN